MKIFSVTARRSLNGQALLLDLPPKIPLYIFFYEFLLEYFYRIRQAVDRVISTWGNKGNPPTSQKFAHPPPVTPVDSFPHQIFITPPKVLSPTK